MTVEINKLMINRYAAIVEYKGTHYFGWQQQNHSELTIQTQIENALSQIANQPIKVVCSGRTDKGVHSVYQVIHFDSSAKRSMTNWLLGTNHLLPKDITISHIESVDKNFHARFDAIAREYHYFIDNQNYHSSIYAEITTPFHHPLDEKKMYNAGQYLIGKHDFSSFRSANCHAKSPVREIHKISINRYGRIIVCQFVANSYLNHMVRNIMGTLMTVGVGEIKPIQAKEILALKDRTKAPKTALPQGLFLTHIQYSGNSSFSQPSRKLPLPNEIGKIF